MYQLTISDKKYQKATNGQQVKSFKLTELTMVLGMLIGKTMVKEETRLDRK